MSFLCLQHLVDLYSSQPTLIDGYNETTKNLMPQGVF